MSAPLLESLYIWSPFLPHMAGVISRKFASPFKRKAAVRVRPDIVTFAEKWSFSSPPQSALLGSLSSLAIALLTCCSGTVFITDIHSSESDAVMDLIAERSEERRVGKEC